MYDTSSDNETMDVASSGLAVPERSRKIYDKVYQDFMNWRISNNKQSFTEEVVLAYFREIAHKFKYSTLSTYFSVLKNTLLLNHKVDISRYSKVNDFLKHKAEGYTGKKSKVFSPEEINKFLTEAQDDKYLPAKVALIFGIVGACRRQELYKLLFKDVEVYESRILVNIHNTTSKSRMFTITGDYYKLVKKYISLRPDDCCSRNFFIHLQPGNFTSMSVGINQFGNLGKSIAKFLGLPNPELYTGHCFRRTSATILVDPDGDILPLKGHPRYKTIPEPESCIKDSVVNSVEYESVKSKNESKIIPETCSNNFTEIQFQDPNQFLNSFENQNIEHVNISIPNNIEASENMMENKDEVWNQIKKSLFKKKTNTPGTSVSEDYYDDSMEDEGEVGNPQNPLEDNNKVVNINMEGTSSSLQHMLSTLVRFNNCNIQNINIYCNK